MCSGIKGNLEFPDKGSGKAAATAAAAKQPPHKKKRKAKKGSFAAILAMFGDSGTLDDNNGDDDDDDDDEEEAPLDLPPPAAAASGGSGGAAAAASVPASKDGELLLPSEFERVSLWLSRRALELELKAKIVDCPRPGCGESLLLEQKDVGKKDLRCAKCDTVICTMCGAVAALGHMCVTLHLSAEEKKQMKKLKLRMCPSCGNGVQKSVGCISMMCRCGAQFCEEARGASGGAYLDRHVRAPHPLTVALPPSAAAALTLCRLPVRSAVVRRGQVQLHRHALDGWRAGRRASGRAGERAGGGRVCRRACRRACMQAGGRASRLARAPAQ